MINSNMNKENLKKIQKLGNEYGIRTKVIFNYVSVICSWNPNM